MKARQFSSRASLGLSLSIDRSFLDELLDANLLRHLILVCLTDKRRAQEGVGGEVCDDSRLCVFRYPMGRCRVRSNAANQGHHEMVHRVGAGARGRVLAELGL